MSIERYSTEMAEFFKEEHKLKRWIDVEIALLRAHADLGNIDPKELDFDELSRGKEKVTLSRVKEIEREIDHDLMAMVKALAEQCPKSGKYLHMGATSYDIEDTATALIFKDALDLLEKHLIELARVLKDLALKYQESICIGRTHGQHALPTTFGMKFALFANDVVRCIDRLREVKKRALVGKMSGAVGTMASFSDKGVELEKRVMEILGLEPADITNQVVQRDIHAEVISLLAIISSTCEKMAKEVRNLQRTDIFEWAEGFGKKQVGSSTMPHKRNPHKSERICSLARLIRSNLMVALENIALEHERDLTNSANERFIFSQSFTLTDYIVKTTRDVFQNIVVYEDNALQNLQKTKGLVFAERVMLKLTQKGMDRQKAHELIRELSQNAYHSGKWFSDVLKSNKEVISLLSEKEIDELFDPKSYLGCYRKLIERAIRKVP